MLKKHIIKFCLIIIIILNISIFVNAESRSSNSTSTSEWTMFGRTLENNRYYPDSINMTDFGLLWSISIGNVGEKFIHTPVIYNNVVYVGGNDSYLYGLNASNGNQLWNNTINVSSSPAIADDKLYIGSMNDFAYSLNLTTGLQIWNQTLLNNSVSVGTPYLNSISSPLVSNGIVYFAKEYGPFFALNASNGNVIWNFSIAGSRYLFTQVISEGIIYLQDYGMTGINALNVTTGNPIWNTSDRSTNSPSIYNNTIFFSNSPFSAFNVKTRDPIWNTSVGGMVTSTAISNNIVYLGSNDQNIHALNITNGTSIWDYNTQAQIFSSPTISDNILVVGSNDNKTYILNISTGAHIWNYTTGGEVSSSPSIADGIVYIGSDDGKIYAFSAGNPPNPNSTALAITNVKNTSITNESLDISWYATKHLNVSVINYGEDINLGTTSVYGQEAYQGVFNDSLTMYEINLIGLEHNTTYFYNVSGYNGSVFNQSGPYNFTTLDTDLPPNSTAIAITAVVNTSITNQSANITWITNIVTTTTVIYGTTIDLGTSTTNTMDDTQIIHNITLDGLTSNTTYFYNVSGYNGTTFNQSGPYNFTTEVFIPAGPEPISNISSNSTSTSEWTMFGRTLENNRYYPDSVNMANFSLIWNISISSAGSYFVHTPIVYNNVVYVAGNMSDLYALNISNGNQLWNLSINVSSSPAIADDKLYISSYTDNNTYAFNVTTGVQIWNRTIVGVQYSSFSSASIYEGTLYIVKEFDNFYALNSTTGVQIWNQSSYSRLMNSPTIHSNIIYSPVETYDILALNRSNGVIIWNSTLSGSPSGSSSLSSPNIYNDYLYVAGYSGYFSSLNATTGSVIWNKTVAEDHIFSSATASGEKIYLGSNDNNVYSINSTNGEQIWNYTTQGDLSSPTISDNVLVVGSRDNKTYILNISTGEIIWNYTTFGEVSSSPSIVNGKVFIGSDDGVVYAFGTDECIPSLTWTNLSCQTNDNLSSYPTDNNGCYAQTGLETDNLPANQTHSCDYCIPNWACNIHNETGNCNSTLDLNDCYSITELIEDNYSGNYSEFPLSNFNESIIGNETDINSTTNTTILIENKTIGNWSSMTGVLNVTFKQGGNTLVEFNYNFSSKLLNLSNITVERQNGVGAVKGYIFVRGLQQDGNKTIYLHNVSTNFNWVCIKDADLSDISQITSSCSGTNEYHIQCNNQTSSGYKCEDLGSNMYKITGLQHSGITQSDAPVTSTTPSGGGGGGGGGSSPSVENIVLTKEGVIYNNLARNSKLAFSSNSITHTLTINQISTDKVEFTLASDPITFELLNGEQKTIQLNPDESLFIQVNNIVSRKTDILLKKIVKKKLELISIPPKEEVGEEEQIVEKVYNSEEVVPISNNMKIKSVMIWSIVSLIVIIGVVGGILFPFSKTEKINNKIKKNR
jgi:outer membrane protein assembly factor BamB